MHACRRFEAETNGDYLRVLDVSLDPIVEPEAEGPPEGEEEEEDEDDFADEEDTSYGGPVRAVFFGSLSESYLHCAAQ
jgi:hypothetical protein